jgi:hypothetical protein
VVSSASGRHVRPRTRTQLEQFVKPVRGAHNPSFDAPLKDPPNGNLVGGMDLQPGVYGSSAEHRGATQCLCRRRHVVTAICPLADSRVDSRDRVMGVRRDGCHRKTEGQLLSFRVYRTKRPFRLAPSQLVAVIDHHRWRPQPASLARSAPLDKDGPWEGVDGATSHSPALQDSACSTPEANPSPTAPIRRVEGLLGRFKMRRAGLLQSASSRCDLGPLIHIHILSS